MVKREGLGGSDERKPMEKRVRLGGSDERKPMVKRDRLGGSDARKAMVKWERLGISDECKAMVKQEPLGGSVESKESVDRISELPNELLGSILSLLTLKEATATSILSRRWKYMWTSITKLDFEATEELEEIWASLSLKNKRSNYIIWVNRVIAACNSSSISCSRVEEFRISFDLTGDSRKHIDKWLRFAVSRKVERLELSLTSKGSPSTPKCEERYTFPYGKVNFPNDFSFIKKLITHYVNVSGEALEFFLGNCPLLEQLSVSGSGHLQALKIVGTFPSFKCLDISLCFNLESVIIRDSNIVSFKYSGNRVGCFQLLNVPLLTEIWIGGEITVMEHVVEMFSGVLPQLEMFKICFLYRTTWEETAKFLSRVEMSNLKDLVVNTGNLHIADDFLLPLINLIRASPNLERFVLERFVFEMQCIVRNAKKPPRPDRMIIPSHYTHLKEVESVGYHGENRQVKLVKEVATVENMVVDTRGSRSCELDRCRRIRVPQPMKILNADKALVRFLNVYVPKPTMATAYDPEKQLRRFVPSRINIKILNLVCNV